MAIMTSFEFHWTLLSSHWNVSVAESVIAESVIALFYLQGLAPGLAGGPCAE